MFAQRILVRPIGLRHRLIDHCDSLGLVVVEIGKETPALQRDAHQVKVFGRDD